MATPPARGYYVEVDHPTTGHTHTPSVLEGERVRPQPNPKANALPTLRVPVERSEKWQRSWAEDAVMRVWLDGKRQPVDELKDVSTTPGGVVLEGKGGLELETRVTPEYDFKEIHLAVEDLINNNTTYTANVDAPNNTEETNVVVQSADTTTELSDRLASAIAADTPAEERNGNLELLQAAFGDEAEDADSGTVGSTNSNSSASGGSEVKLFDDGIPHSIQESFTVDYKIPSSNLKIAYRFYVDDANENPALAFKIDGTQVATLPQDWTSETSFAWDIEDASSFGDLSAGNHDFSIEINSETTNEKGINIDYFVIYDDRHIPAIGNWDNSVDADGFLSDPKLYPGSVSIEFQDATPTRSVTGGRIESTWNDTSGNQQVGLSVDSGSSYTTSANTDTFETDFSGLNATLRWRATLSRWGSRSTATPTSGFKGQQVESYTLKADLDDTPVFIDQKFDRQLKDVLRVAADQAGDATWEYRRTGNTESVEWTFIGQRTADETPDVATYDVSKSTADIVEKANVYGSALTVNEEQFTANHGTAVALNHDHLEAKTERVYDDSTSPPTEYTKDTDYNIDYQNGEITTLASGSITDGATLTVDYDWRPFGSYTASGVNNPREERFTISGLTTTPGCGLVATRIVNEFGSAQLGATVEVPNDEVGWSVIEAINPAQVPTNGTALHINDVDNLPAKTKLQLGDRESLGDFVAGLQQRINAVAQG